MIIECLSKVYVLHTVHINTHYSCYRITDPSRHAHHSCDAIDFSGAASMLLIEKLDDGGMNRPGQNGQYTTTATNSGSVSSP